MYEENPEEFDEATVKWWINELKRQITEEIKYMVEFTFNGNTSGVENCQVLLTNKVISLIWYESMLEH